MIRWAEVADIPALADMAERMMADSTFSTLVFDREKFSKHCETVIGYGFAMVAIKDDNIIGAMLGDASAAWYSMDMIGFDYGLYIEPEHRSGLIAAKLVRLFEKWCKDMNVKQIRLGTSTGNNEASRLYQALGFTVTGELFFKDLGD